MTWQATPYTLPLALIAALSGCLAVYTWRRRSVQGALPAAIVMAAIALWSASYALEMASATLEAKTLWGHLRFVGIVITPAAWLCFALLYANRPRWVNPRFVALLCVEPILTLAMRVTNPAHHWMYTRVELVRTGGFYAMSAVGGPWFWVHTIHSYALLLLGSLLLIEVLVHSFYLFRWQASVLLVALLAPWVGNALYLSGLSPFPELDLTPFAFVVSAACIAWSLFCLRTADVVPVARAAVIESMGDGVVLLDAQNREMYLNPVAQRWLGRLAQHAVGEPADGLWPDWSALLERLRAGDTAGQEVEWCPARAAPTLGVRLSAMLDWRGRLVSQIVVLRDISARKRAEEELRQLKEFNEGLVLGMAEALILEDERGLITFVNPALQKLLGYTAPELLGRPWQALVPPAEVPKVQTQIERRSSGSSEQYETLLLAKDGHEVPVLINARPLFREGVFAGVLSACTEISALKRAEEERKRVEEELRQADKMEAFGLLAGEVAHDFGNLLSVILGNTQLGLAEVQPNEPPYEELVNIERTSLRAAELAQQLLAFGRRRLLQPTLLDLNHVVGESRKMLELVIGQHIELRLELAPDLPAVQGDAGVLEQVLMNLVLNARDAMPEGGRITIATAPVTLDTAFCNTHPEATPGTYVRLSVTDTGTGMSEWTRQRIFEPFFTTKEPGKGTGLGLSAVYGIVRQHNGWTDVQSQAGQGTQFDVYLPPVRN